MSLSKHGRVLSVGRRQEHSVGLPRRGSRHNPRPGGWPFQLREQLLTVAQKFGLCAWRPLDVSRRAPEQLIVNKAHQGPNMLLKTK